MCDQLPDLRCARHTRRRLAADTQWRDTLTEELDGLDTRDSLTPRLAARRREVVRLIERREDQIRFSLADLNAAPKERKWLAEQLVELLGDRNAIPAPAAASTEDTDLRRCAVNLLEGKLQRAERRRQVALMPTPPTAVDDPSAAGVWGKLARRRSKMACARTQMALSGDDLEQWKRWRDLHRRHAAEARNLHAQFVAILAGGADWWDGATDDARAEVVQQVSREADFTTPTVPRTLPEAIAEVIAQQSCRMQVTSADPALDTDSWAQERGEDSPVTRGFEGAPGEEGQESGGSPERELSVILNAAEQRADTVLTDINCTGEEQKARRITAAEYLQDNARPAGWVILQYVLTGLKGPPTS